jgi:Tfp pilus assembly protein PilO
MQIDRPIAIASTLFIILLMVFFLVMPEYNKFVKLQAELGQKTAQYRAQVDYYAAIAKTYEDLQARQDDVNKIDDALPQDPALGKLIYFLQETGKENGLTVKDVFLSKLSTSNVQVGAANSVKDLVLSMDLSGDYASLLNFIFFLEKSSRIFEVSSISFDSSTGPPYNFSLQVKTHSY